MSEEPQTLGTIESLVGESLSAVSFVMDYVQIHFDGAVITALTNPTVEFGEQQWRFPGPGSRDALCSLIGATVSRVSVVPETAIELLFTTGQRLVIPLDWGSRLGPEAAHFRDGVRGALQIF